MLENAVINGTGAGQPLGIANSDAKIEVAKEASQSADTIVVANIRKMFGRLWPRSAGNAVWLCGQDCLPQIWSATDGSGTYYNPNLKSSPYGGLMGRPVFPVEQADTVGDAGDIQLLDLNEYILARKGGVKADWSMHVRFIYGEQVFRISTRVDGQPAWHSALTPANSTNTLSPYVWLAVRS
jgi:HK97 family phage major capsid protein